VGVDQLDLLVLRHRQGDRLRAREERRDIAERPIRRETGEEPTLAVDREAPESVQARIELAQRAGFTADPEAVQERM